MNVVTTKAFHCGHKVPLHVVGNPQTRPRDLIFAGMMLSGIVVLFIVMPRHKLAIRGYSGTLREGRRRYGNGIEEGSKVSWYRATS